MDKRLLVTVALAAVLASPVMAQEPTAPSSAEAAAARETPPEGGTPRDFKLPETTHYQLDNGMKVTLIPFGAVPKATVSAQIMAGNLNDGENTWISDLAVDLMQEGTTSKTAEEVARTAAEMGGSVNAGVGMDQTSVTGNALSEFTPDMIELIADVIRNPAMPEEDFDRLRADRLRNLEISENDPSTMAQAAFRKALYGDHPYGRILPTKDQLEGYTREQVKQFHADNVGAQRTHLFVSGVFNESAVRDAIANSFGDWAKGPAELDLPPTPAAGRQYVEMINRANASQSNLIMGLPTVNPASEDYVPMMVTNAMLGGSFGSRITRNIREDKGYTYSPFSQVSTRKGDGYWAQQAAITTDDTSPALKEIYHEINRLRDEPPSAEELKAIQNYLAGIFTLQNSSRGGIINQLNNVDLHNLDESYLTDYVSKIYAVTPEGVSEVASEHLRPEDMTVVVVGDRGRISEDMAEWLDEGE